MGPIQRRQSTSSPLAPQRRGINPAGCPIVRKRCPIDCGRPHAHANAVLARVANDEPGAGVLDGDILATVALTTAFREPDRASAPGLYPLAILYFEDDFVHNDLARCHELVPSRMHSGDTPTLGLRDAARVIAPGSRHWPAHPRPRAGLVMGAGKTVIAVAQAEFRSSRVSDDPGMVSDSRKSLVRWPPLGSSISTISGPPDTWPDRYSCAVMTLGFGTTEAEACQAAGVAAHGPPPPHG
jgi:hypothetical protein